MKKYIKILFNNEIFFPSYKIPFQISFGDYIVFLIINALKIFGGAILLILFVLSIDLLLNLINKNNLDKSLFHIEEGTFNYYVVVFLSIICSIYFLFSFFHNVFLNFSYLSRVFNSSSYRMIKNEYHLKIRKINIDLRQKLIESTVNNSKFDFESEFNQQKEALRFNMKKKFLQNELKKVKNIQSSNIEIEKNRIEELFETLIK